MRGFISFLTIVLFVIGFLALAIALIIIGLASGHGAPGMTAGLVAAAVPALIAAVALGSGAIVCAVEQASKAQVTAANRNTDATTVVGQHLSNLIATRR